MADTEDLRKARIQAVAPQRTGEVGALLKGARMSAGLDLREVANSLRIRHPYLIAIEEGRYEDLPGAAYAVGFVRSYAEHVHLDGDEIVRRFKEEGSIVPRNAELDFPAPDPDGGMPSGALVVVALVLGGLAYGAWYWTTTSDRPLAEMIQDVPDRFAALISPEAGKGAATPVAAKPETAVALEKKAEPEAVATPATPATPAVVAAAEPSAPPASAPVVVQTAPAPAAVVVTPAVSEPAPAETVDVQPPSEEDATPEPEVVTPADVPAASSVAADAPAPPVKPATPVAPALAPVTPAPEVVAPAPAVASAAEGRVTLIAREDSWVQVRDSQGLLLSRLLKAGERYDVPKGEGLTLMVGNAGGLRVAIDGTELPPLGRTGEVLRGVSLVPKSLRATFGGTN